MLTSDQLNSYRAKLKPQHTTEEHKKEIGGNLQRARKKTGLTQEDVAEILGWGGRKVGRIESGETLCSPEDILSLCQIYDCNLTNTTLRFPIQRTLQIPIYWVKPFGWFIQAG